MKDNHSKSFIEALRANDLETIRKIPKSDLHNHFTHGGNREYIKKRTGHEIMPLTHTLKSMDEMHKWTSDNYGPNFDSTEMRKLLIDATFVQAKYDGIHILEVGEDVWALNEYFDNDIGSLISAFKNANKSFSPETKLRLQIGLSRHCSIPYLERVIEPFWEENEFYSLDLYGDEMAQPIENFQNIYAKAKKNGLRVKAHVGEWGTASDVVRAIQHLELDEIQHGIAIAKDDYAMDFVKERGIRLNITPTSNVKLGRVNKITEHPIRILFEKGINITINSDDTLIFDSDVSKEYMRLYQHNVLGVEELDQIRLNGLVDIKP
jgi:adenosine deaminase